MICWDRLGADVVIGVLEADEPSRLLELLDWARTLLATWTPEDDATPTHSALLAILAARRDREHGEPANWPEVEVFDTSHAMMTLALETIPSQGTVMTLPSFNHVFAWLWALTDLGAARARDARWLAEIGESLEVVVSAERAQRVDHFW
jgi:hypothetical protein